MPDRRKVVTGLKCCTTHPNEYGDCMSEDCPYKSINCVDHLLQDALALLQAQEPVPPESGRTTRRYNCGYCHFAIEVGDKYCKHCGKAVKWDD